MRRTRTVSKLHHQNFVTRLREHTITRWQVSNLQSVLSSFIHQPWYCSILTYYLVSLWYLCVRIMHVDCYYLLGKYRMRSMPLRDLNKSTRCVCISCPSCVCVNVWVRHVPYNYIHNWNGECIFIYSVYHSMLQFCTIILVTRHTFKPSVEAR